MIAIGIDLGGTNLRAAAVTDAGEVLEKRARPLGDPADGDGIVEAVAGMALDLLSRGGAMAVGIGAAGPLDHRAGVMYSPPNIPGLKNMPLASRVALRVGLPVRLENDANAAVFGEYRAGAGRGASVLVGLTLGTGVGGGIVLDGELFRGPDGSAGELGHIVVDPEGPSCSCGGRGHLEAYASATATLKRFADGVSAGRAALPGGWTGGVERVTAADIDRFARDGHAFAADALAETGRRLGDGIATLVNVFDPDMVVLLGGLTGAFDLFGPAMRAAIRAQAVSPGRERVRVVPGELGGDAGLVGAALLALGAGAA